MMERTTEPPGNGRPSAVADGAADAVGADEIARRGGPCRRRRSSAVDAVAVLSQAEHLGAPYRKVDTGPRARALQQPLHLVLRGDQEEREAGSAAATGRGRAGRRGRSR